MRQWMGGGLCAVAMWAGRYTGGDGGVGSPALVCL
jgi:hypothetical protein